MIDESYFEIPRQDVDQLIRKRPAVKAKTSNVVKFTFPIRDNNYNIINLSSLGFTSGQSSSNDYSLDLVVKEGTLLQTSTYTGVTTAKDPTNGLVEVNFDTNDLLPGIYFMSIGMKENSTNKILVDNEVFLYLERSLRSPATTNFPSVDDIRLALRDSDPLENELLEWYDFSLSDICMALLRTIHQINAIPPPIQPFFTTSKEIEFDMWVDGATLFLFDMATEHYRRNRLPYNAGGLALDDKAKEENYLRAWKIKFDLWYRKVSARKIWYNSRRLYNVVSTRGAVRGYGYSP